MNLEENIKKALENLEKYESVVFNTDNKISEQELNEIKKNLMKSLEKVVIDKKNFSKMETLILNSNEQIDERHIAEAVRRIIEESNKEQIEETAIKEELIERFTKYLESRNLSKEQIENLTENYKKNGISKELKNEIKTSIINNLKANNYDDESINSIVSIIDEEINKVFDINKDIKSILEEKLIPKSTKYKAYSSLPLVQINNYEDTVEGIQQFGKDYGISENLINELLNTDNQDDIINKIIAELEKNNIFLGNEEENSKIKQFFKEEIKNKLDKINNKLIKPIDALEQIYKEIGISDEEKNKFLSTIKQKGKPGKDFYKKLKVYLENQKAEEYAKIKSMLETVNVDGKKKKKVKKILSEENKKVVLEDYKEIIRMRQQIFNNIYNLNRMVAKDSKELVSPKTYEIVNVKKANDSKIANRVKKETIKQHLGLKEKIIDWFCNEPGEEEYENTTLKIL